MLGDMNGQIAMAGLKQGMSFISGLMEAKNERRWQAYRNAMTRISAGQSNNAITVNENMAIERSTIQGFEIDKTAYTTHASIEASAAATDTAGRSVNQTLFAADRNAAVAQHTRIADLNAQIMGFENQRRTLAFQTATQIDHTSIPNPSPVTAMLGFAKDVVGIRNKFGK